MDIYYDSGSDMSVSTVDMPHVGMGRHGRRGRRNQPQWSPLAMRTQGHGHHVPGEGNPMPPEDHWMGTQGEGMNARAPRTRGPDEARYPFGNLREPGIGGLPNNTTRQARAASVFAPTDVRAQGIGFIYNDMDEREDLQDDVVGQQEAAQDSPYYSPSRRAAAMVKGKKKAKKTTQPSKKQMSTARNISRGGGPPNPGSMADRKLKTRNREAASSKKVEERRYKQRSKKNVTGRSKARTAKMTRK
jgi:hypothetical protein